MSQDWIEAAANEIHDVQSVAIENFSDAILTEKSIADILRRHSPPLPQWCERIERAILNWVEDDEITETANRLDQLFRQRHRMRDVHYELRDLLKRLRGPIPSPPAQETKDA